MTPSAASLHEASGRRGALPWAIRPLDPSMRIRGPACTVEGPGGDNLWLHRAIYAAAPGDVLVVFVQGAYEHGYWGDIMTNAAIGRGLGGLVIDGGVRDGESLRALGFPVFARGLCIRGTAKDHGARGFVNAPLLIGDVAVSPGDLVVGDGDGVVIVPRDAAPEIVRLASERETREQGILDRLRAGETTLEIYGL